MDTAVVTIGNSDDKLTQQEWSRFVFDVSELIAQTGYQIYFHGHSAGSAPWQNACWTFGIKNDLAAIVTMRSFRKVLSSLAMKYNQDSIALCLGETVLVTPNE